MLLLSWKSKNYIGGNREKSNIAVAILEKKNKLLSNILILGYKVKIIKNFV